jgi:hypothetical protein
MLPLLLLLLLPLLLLLLLPLLLHWLPWPLRPLRRHRLPLLLLLLLLLARPVEAKVCLHLHCHRLQSPPSASSLSRIIEDTPRPLHAATDELSIQINPWQRVYICEPLRGETSPP